MCCDSPSMPDPNPGIIESAEAAKEIAEMQKETAMEYLNFSKEQYAEIAPFIKQIAESQAQIAAANKTRADEYAAYEKDTFRPLEKDLVQKANEFDTEQKREQLAEAGMADVAAAYEQQRKQAIDTLARYGINPNSARFAAINSQLAMSEAGDRAGVANRSRWQAEDLGRAMKYDAAALGRGLASNSSTAYGVALNAGNSAVGNRQAAGSALGGAYGQATQMLSSASGSMGTAGNLYGQDFSARMQKYNAEIQDSGFGDLLGMGVKGAIGFAGGGWGGVGNMLAGAKIFADGGAVKKDRPTYALHVGAGPVSGPGGPVDDKIDAKLSDGEYVLPADTVKAIGKKKLDKLVKQTHTPAAIQRRRAALEVSK